MPCGGLLHMLWYKQKGDIPMHARTHRTRGRVVPPPVSAPVQQSSTDPLAAADELLLDDLGVVELRFTPSLTWRAFRRFAARYGLVHTPQPYEPQIFLSPSRIEVAYGMRSISPLPRQVEELWLVGADGPDVEAMIALVAAMLDAWPHARWTPGEHDGFTPILRHYFPEREGVRTR